MGTGTALMPKPQFFTVPSRENRNHRERCERGSEPNILWKHTPGRIEKKKFYAEERITGGKREGTLRAYRLVVSVTTFSK